MELETLKQWVIWMWKWAMLFIVVGFFIGLLPFGRDDTDGDWPNRSGLNVKIDALTGCQYLEVKSGGITPRIDGKGAHVGCRV